MKYENTIVTYTSTPAIDVLNKMGLAGWEPYAVSKNAVYFKRPIEEDKQEAPKEPSQSFVDQVLGVFQEIKDHALTDIFG